MSEQVTKFIVPKDKAWNAETHSKALPHEQLMVLAAEHDSAIRSLHAEAEALRAGNGRLSQQLAQSDAALRESRANDMANVRTLEDMWERHDALRQELEAARGLLELCHAELNEPADSGFEMSLRRRVGAFLTATPAPEVPDHTENVLEMAEQGERQEAVDALLLDDCVEYSHPGYGGGYFGTDVVQLYRAPQPSQDVRALVEAISSAHPRIDPNSPVPLDEEKHCCEHTLYLERERLHKLLDAHRQAQRQA